MTIFLTVALDQPTKLVGILTFDKYDLNIMRVVKQQFSTGIEFFLLGDIWQCGKNLVVTTEEEVLLASTRQKPVMLLNIRP